jgi:hypothetical protein
VKFGIDATNEHISEFNSNHSLCVKFYKYGDSGKNSKSYFASLMKCEFVLVNAEHGSLNC